MVEARWPVRPVPSSLRDRYRAEGWWSDDTLGSLVDRSLSRAPGAGVHIWSELRPWHGTYADVRLESLRLVTALRAADIDRGDVVAFQLPNWREAVVAFYGLAMGGYVLVPVVPIYGAKEVRFILRESRARAYISADQYGHVDYVDIVDGAAPDALPDLALHVVVGEPVVRNQRAPGTAARVERVPWDVVGAAEPAVELRAPDPDAVCVLAYTSGTTSDPKGALHTHRTLLAEIPHIQSWITPGSPNLMGSPVTHATGMLGAVLAPMALGEAIHLIDRWVPARVLEVMLAADVGAGTGAAVFLSSLLNDPAFTPEHARRIRRVGLRGAPVPRALGERAAAHGIALIRAYGSTEHPSITGSTFTDPAAEIEDAIAALPEVAEVAVVAAPDARLGEHVCAFVRLVPEAETIELRAITEHLERVGVARPKWPEELHVVADLPRTAAGKVRKVELRAQLRAAGSEVGA